MKYLSLCFAILFGCGKAEMHLISIFVMRNEEMFRNFLAVCYTNLVKNVSNLSSFSWTRSG